MEEGEGIMLANARFFPSPIYEGPYIVSMSYGNCVYIPSLEFFRLWEAYHYWPAIWHFNGKPPF